MIQRHRPDERSTLIFVSSRYLILRYTHELISEVSTGGAESFQPIPFEKEISSSREIGSVRLNLHLPARAVCTLVRPFFFLFLFFLFPPEAEAYRIGGMGSIFSVRGFSRGFLA